MGSGILLPQSLYSDVYLMKFYIIMTIHFSVIQFKLEFFYVEHQLSKHLCRVDDMSGYKIECLFKIDKGHVQCLIGGIKIFL